MCTTAVRYLLGFKRVTLYFQMGKGGALWVDFKKMDFSKGTPTMEIDADASMIGDVSHRFTETAPLKFAKP